MVGCCEWAQKDPLLQNFHDFEWGHPIVDEQELFEKLCLHCQSAGGFKTEKDLENNFDTSQIAYLASRETYRSKFANFDPQKLADYSSADIDNIVNEDKSHDSEANYKHINRNKQKLKSIITNAKAFIKLKAEGVNFSELCWSFTGGKVIIGGKTREDLQVIAENMSKKLKEYGFSYTSPTVCLGFMETVGIINSHIPNCCVRSECLEEAKIFGKF